VNDGVDGRTELGGRVTVLLHARRLSDQRLLLPAVHDRLLMNVLPQHQSAVSIQLGMFRSLKWTNVMSTREQRDV